MITYDENDFSPKIRYVDKPMQGTMISVRNIHKNTKSIQTTYKKYRENHYDNAIA
jgi:hypothetical protein